MASEAIRNPRTDLPHCLGFIDDCIAAFSKTDFTEDLKAIPVPVLIMHGEDDQVVPIDISARKAITLVRDGRLKTYPGLSHGLFATHPDLVNADLLAFACLA